MIKFLSIDSSLANTGIAAGIIVGREAVEVESIYLCSTEKSKNKQIRASSDTIERCSQTSAFIQEMIEKEKPDIIFVETPSGSQSAAGMKSYGATCQLIATLQPVPIQVTPIEVKLASVGKKTASKKDMIEWAVSKYPNLNWPIHRGQVAGKAEHMADAIAITYAGIKTNQFWQLMRLMAV